MELNKTRVLSLEKAKAKKAEEIVRVLDLFGGHLSLTDCLDTPIPLLNQLEKAKIMILKRG